MSTYYEFWKANEAIGQQAVTALMLGGLVLVLGWLVIPMLLPARLQTISRWGYIAILMVLAALVVYESI